METKDERLLELKLSLTLNQHYMFFIFLHTLVDCGYFYTVQQHHRWLRELTSNMKLSKDLIVLDYLFWSGDESLAFCPSFSMFAFIDERGVTLMQER